ncbi:Lin0368 family putative glycerol transporter subunit [Anaerosinus gibii]|uniref:Uncharacterized protein n=1 Tax=Selenobaculum gibii TaxID=3054208 RepID=A0A9Y2AHS7_9FIRM|nr:hypothetical protein [Selenobaculum gbiensis]WIW70193.1 hypothetical protein P3F81_09870 [Selenobaculum gbiensis]
MSALRTIVGTAIAGIFVMSVWGAFSNAYGIGGGWFAGFMIISIMWFMNHFVGIMHNPAGGAWVDMALGIAICGTMRDVFMAGSVVPLMESIPTILVVVLGGITGGITAVTFQKNIQPVAETKKENSLKAS